MKDHWERLAAKKYVYSIKTVVNCKTTIPTSTSLQSGVYGKQSKKEKDKNAYLKIAYLRDAARDQVSKANRGHGKQFAWSTSVP